MSQTFLDKAVANISLTGGVDRKTDAHQLHSGQMYTADNVVYVSEKQIKKRNGYAGVYPPGGFQGAPFTAIGNRDNVEPVILGQNTLNRYNAKTGLSTYIPALTQGRLTSRSIAASTAVPNPTLLSNAQVASDGTLYLFTVYTESSLSWYGVQDLATGNWIISPRMFAAPVTTYNGTATGPLSNLQTLYYNGYFYVFYQVGSQFYGAYALALTNLAYSFVDTGLRVPAVNNSNFSVYDYVAQIDNSGVLNFLSADPAKKAVGVITYYSVNGPTFTLQTKTTSLPTPSGVTYAGVNPTYQLAVNGPARAPIAATVDLYFYGVTATNTASAGLAVGISSLEKTQLMFRNGLCVYTMQTGGNRFTRYSSVVLGQYNTVTNTIGTPLTLNPPAQTNAAFSFSAPFTGVNVNCVYQWVTATSTNGGTDYPTAFLFEANLASNTTSIVARCLYLSAALAPNHCQVVNLGNNQYVTMLPSATDEQFQYGVLNRVVFDFTPARQNALLPLPTGGLIGCGAFPYQYDGQRIFEQGFSSAPSIDNSLVSQSQVGVSTGMGLTPNFRYSYQFCYVRRDAYGNDIRSSPGTTYMFSPSQVNNGGAAYATTFPAFAYVNDPNVVIEAYRNTVATPSEFYYVATVPNGTAFTDTYADSAIVGNRNLYTYSGELPNDPCPPVHAMAVSESRVYVIPSDNRNTVWASKQFSPGRGVEFSASLVLSEGRNSGLFTAIAVLDSNVIVFKQDAVLYFYGTGVDNTGANGSFSAFTKLSSDVGCVDPNSLAIIPAGLLFRSRRGIELLSRGLQLQYVGFPIEPYVQSIASITASVILPQYNQVRFMSAVQTDPTLVYDYMFNRWSTFSNTSVTACSTISGAYWCISPDGSTVLMETPGIYSDNGANIIMTLETPELAFAGIQGWSRAYRMAVLGDFKSSHQLNVSFAYDHSPVYQDQVGYSTAIQADIDALAYLEVRNLGWDLENPNSTADPFLPRRLSTPLGRAPTVVVPPCAEQFRLSRMPRQRMQSCRIMLQDTPVLLSYSDDAGVYQTMPLAFGESCAISAITIEYGQKAGVAKLGPQGTI